MAIILPSGFNITNNDPVDARFSVADQAARLGFSLANVYEGLTVYQRDNNGLYILVDSANPSVDGSWTLLGTGGGGVGIYATTGSNTFVGNQTITGSIYTTGSNVFLGTTQVVSTLAYTGSDFFLIRNTTTTVKVNAGMQVSSSAQTPLQVLDQNNNNILNVSQSGVVTFATQSSAPTGTAPNGAIWITNTDLYVGLT